MDAVRAFVAVLLDDATRAALGTRIERLRGVADGVAWVAPDNLHVTLKFLGQVATDRLDAVRAALARAVSGVAPFALCVSGLGAYPTASRARVIWAGVTEGREALVHVAAAVDRSLADVNFAPEARTFSPHVTLGRVREPRHDTRLQAAVTDGAGERFGALTVERIALVQSQLSPRGARYTEIGAFPLR